MLMVYRMVRIGVWADYCGVRSQATRNLKIHTSKMQRICWSDKGHLMFKVESLKKVDRLEIKNAREISRLYETIAAEVSDVFRDIAKHKGEEITEAQIKQRANAFLADADAYAKKHAPK